MMKSNNEDLQIELKVITDESNYINKLYDLSGDIPYTESHFHFAGCSSSDYFVAEK